MISFEGVRKTYRTKAGPRVILEHLDLMLDSGINLGILGLNGAGKSTFLQLLSGIELPDRGLIRRQVRVSFPLGYSGSFVSTLSGRENVSFIARIYGLDPSSLARFVDDFAELGRYFDEPIRTYSSGMRARLGFAVSIGIDFDLYLIDEATAAGDARFAARCEIRPCRAPTEPALHNGLASAGPAQVVLPGGGGVAQRTLDGVSNARRSLRGI